MISNIRQGDRKKLRQGQTDIEGCSKKPARKAAASENPRRTVLGTLRV